MQPRKRIHKQRDKNKKRHTNRRAVKQTHRELEKRGGRSVSTLKKMKKYAKIDQPKKIYKNLTRAVVRFSISDHIFNVKPKYNIILFITKIRHLRQKLKK